MWTPSDEALVAGLAAGDADAATAFVRRFQARVFGLARTMVGDSAIAEEIAQEAFLRAWRHAPNYDARRGQVATWLLAITRNLAIDRLRVKRTDPIEPERLQAIVDSGSSDEGLDELGAGDVHDAMASLPMEQRRAVVLASVFGYTAREIGEIEGAPLGTAKTRIRAGLMKLRNELGATS